LPIININNVIMPMRQINVLMTSKHPTVTICLDLYQDHSDRTLDEHDEFFQ
jgi:hypothetical protein